LIVTFTCFVHFLGIYSVQNPTVNDFKKAMGSILLTAGATLAKADRIVDRVGTRNNEQQDFALAVEFCHLLVASVEDLGPGFANIQGFPERYCRKHLSRATNFLRQAMATHDPNSREAKRLIHVAGLIERALKRYLDEETAIRCWFGERPSTATSGPERA
jgi:hypothetical protein